MLGVGGMVGAGIFALLGEAGAVAGAAVWISFLIAGFIATLLGYVLVKLGVTYPSSGGIVTYLIKAFGNGRTVGVTSWLGYLTAIVVVGAMVAVSFGDYARSLFIGTGAGQGWTKLFACLVVAASAMVTAVGAKWVDRSQTLIVVTLLAVFAVFIVATLGTLDAHLLAPSGYPSVHEIISSVALTFFAFLGFAVISFAGGDLRNPKRDMPRAMYLALGATTLLYVAISLSVFGTLTVAEVVHYGPTAIAEAARPTLGHAGFLLMSIAALLATSSSVSATMYAAPGFTSALAEVGQFPPAFGRSSRLGRHGGLIVTTIATIVFILLFDLSALASIGSAVSLGVFVLLGVAGLRLRRAIGASLALTLAAIATSATALVVFCVDTFGDDPRAFWAMVALVALSLMVDEAWKRARKSTPEATPQPS
jgi:amino acid transporter